jgi:hypothetical protein
MVLMLILDDDEYSRRRCLRRKGLALQGMTNDLHHSRRKQVQHLCIRFFANVKETSSRRPCMSLQAETAHLNSPIRHNHNFTCTVPYATTMHASVVQHVVGMQRKDLTSAGRFIFTQ